MKKCPNCGHELPEDAKVCNNCGEPVELVNNSHSENKNKSQPMDETANRSEAQELTGEDRELVHEHLEPGLNIEAQKEIEKEDQTDPQNKEAEDHIEKGNRKNKRK